MARWTEFPGDYKIEVNDSDTCIGIDFGDNDTKITLHRKGDSIAMIIVSPGADGGELDVYVPNEAMTTVARAVR